MPVETLESIKIEKREHKEFGQEEAEEMAREFLDKDFDCFRRVWRASEYDDKKQATDLIAELKNGDRLAIQFTITTEPGKPEEKIARALKRSTIELHNDKGQIVDERRTPVIMIHQDKLEWVAAHSQFLQEGREGESPIEYFADRAIIKKDFLDQMISFLEGQAKIHPRKKEIFLSRKDLLQEELEEHLKAYKELAE